MFSLVKTSVLLTNCPRLVLFFSGKGASVTPEVSEMEIWFWGSGSKGSKGVWLSGNDLRMGKVLLGRKKSCSIELAKKKYKGDLKTKRFVGKSGFSDCSESA